LTRPRISVVAGVLYDEAGNVLIAQRAPDAHMGGEWEFPGGKLDPGEGRLAGLVRELREELGVEIESARPLIRIEHNYPDRLIRLDVWVVERYTGTPAGLEGQALRWLAPASLPHQRILAADMPIITAINLGQRLAIVDGGDPDWQDIQETLGKIARAGIDTVCLDAGSASGGAGRARQAAYARGLRVVEVGSRSDIGNFRAAFAVVAGQPDFALALLDIADKAPAQRLPETTEIAAAIARLNVPVFVPAHWIDHDLAAAWQLGAHGVIVPVSA
jgi:mutator protein MutT